MSEDYLAYESSFDDQYWDSNWCRCGMPMKECPTDDPQNNETELLCPYCNAIEIAERQDK